MMSYPVVEQDFRLVGHAPVPQEPHGVIDDEGGEQVAMDVNPGTLQTLAGLPTKRQKLIQRSYQ